MVRRAARRRRDLYRGPLGTGTQLNGVSFRSILAVCAHPDDESFGLGAVLSTLAESGATVRVLCFTRGEATSLGVDIGDLAAVRAAELEAAAAALGVSAVRLCTFADGQLANIEPSLLSREVEQLAQTGRADCLVVFDDGGISSHSDHQAATDAACMAARNLQLPVLAWALPQQVAAKLNDEFGTTFVGRDDAQIDMRLIVDRQLQHKAILCHTSQSTNNPVLWRRLELLGPTEVLRWLVGPSVAAI